MMCTCTALTKLYYNDVNDLLTAESNGGETLLSIYLSSDRSKLYSGKALILRLSDRL